MERTLDIPTAEAVDVRYELAGLGSRFLAVLIDLVVQLAAAGAIFALIAWLPAPITLYFSPLAFRNPISALTLAFFVLAMFAIFFVYFIVFEVASNGRTPGKRALGLRVIRAGGFPVDVTASVIRNLVRIVEVSLGFYLVSALVVLRSPRNQRIGDLAAATIVVRDRAVRSDILDVIRAAANERDDGLSTVDRELIERFVQRRAELDANARVLVAASIAARVRPKLAAAFPHLDDESLLEHLARP
jgi:uncharacterized RDD family membrane protein YckC